MYAIYLKDWLTVFPPEQILVLKADDYYANISVTMSRVFDFLGLERKTLPSLKREAEAINSFQTWYRERHKVKQPMHNVTRNMLSAFYQPYNDMLVQLMNDVRFGWRS